MIFRSASGDIFAGRRNICSKASLNVARGVVDCQHHHPATHWVSENLIPFQNPVFKYWNKPAIANPQCLACSPNQLAEVAWGVWQCFDLSGTFSHFYRIWSLELPSDSRGKRLPGTTDWQPRLQKAEKYGHRRLPSSSVFSLTIAVSVRVHEPRMLTPCKSWTAGVTLLLCTISSASFCAFSFN